MRELIAEEDANAQRLANSLLERALTLDDSRPHDDISVLVLRILDRVGDGVRRLAVSIPM
jgi:hypothetical protein